MKKVLLLIVGIVVLYFGYQNYHQRQLKGLTEHPSIQLDTNSEIANADNVNVHCFPQNQIEPITTRQYYLLNEVYTPTIKVLTCRYESLTEVNNVKPSISYTLQLTNDANGIWTRKLDTLKGLPSFAVSAEHPDSFANINPVKELNQGMFYGKKAGGYIELNYTPVSEGNSTLFNRGMSILDKVLLY